MSSKMATILDFAKNIQIDQKNTEIANIFAKVVKYYRITDLKRFVCFFFFIKKAENTHFY